MTVGVKDVHVAVIVKVGEAGAPAPVSGTHAGFLGDVHEATLAIRVFVQAVAGAVVLYIGIPDAGDKPVQVAIMVVIGHRVALAVFVRNFLRRQIDNTSPPKPFCSTWLDSKSLASSRSG